MHKKINKLQERFWDCIAPILLFFAPYAYFMHFYAYGFNTPASQMLAAVCISVGLIIAIALFYTNWFFRFFLWSIALILSFSFFPLFKAPLFFALLCFFSVLMSYFFLENLGFLLSVFSTVFILTILYLPMHHEFSTAKIENFVAQAANKNPTIVQLIFDEHIGVNALPQTSQAEKALKKDITKFYLHYGFTLYPNAFSHYARTYNAIPNLLNFTPRQEDAAFFPHAFKDLSLTQNKALTLYSQQGYVINVYQPNYINFCKDKAINLGSCFTYPTHSFLFLKNANLPEKDKFLFLLKSFLLHSEVYQEILDLYVSIAHVLRASFSISLPGLTWIQDGVSSLAAPSIFAPLAENIIQHPRGHVYFVHVLLPHSPYIFDRFCHLRPNTNTWLVNYDLPNRTGKRRQYRYSLYEQQLRCNYKLLGSFFSRLQKAGVYDHLVFIVNGDHSARIPLHVPEISQRSLLTQQDFEDVYATLFAVRQPGAAKGKLIDTKQSINTLYANTLRNLLHQKNLPVEKNDQYVFLLPKTPGKHAILEKEKISDFLPVSS